MAGFIPWEARPGWTDVHPIPQAEASNPMVPINYTAEYISAMSTFRYILSKQEISKRVLELTGEIVKMNPAHYTVWAYRSKTLLALKDSEPDGEGIQLLVKELSLLDELVKVHLKNYQVWQHRRIIVIALNDPSRELPFTTRALAFDSKNYHTWAYRQWALSHFYSSPSPSSSSPSPEGRGNEEYSKIWKEELQFTNHLLITDVRNNSAWNHRWFTVFERKEKVTTEIIERELDYTKGKVRMAPGNPSAWNYLRGILDRHSLPYSTHVEWAKSLSSPSNPDTKVILAIEFIADAMSEAEGGEGGGGAKEAEEMYEELKGLDGMRSGYWDWRKGLIGASSKASAAAAVEG